MKAAILIVLFFTLPGVIMGIVSSYRAGQRPHEPVFLRLKIFAQQIFNRRVYGHMKSYWMYYGMLVLFIAMAFSR